jgi:glycosyltransferase involved in cell wall biosynthesis
MSQSERPISLVETLSARPRILYIASCWPHGKAFGGQLRTLHIGRALRQYGDVTLAVVSSDAAGEEAVRLTATEFNVEDPIRVAESPNRTLGDRMRWAFDTRFLNVHGCVAQGADRSRLLDSLDKYDLVWIGNSRTANILNHWQWPHSVLDIDDVPSTFQRTVWRNGGDFRKKLKAGITAVLLKRREMRLKERFTALSVCSEADKQYLGGGDHIHVIPNGFEKPAHEPARQPANPPRLGFIGLYSYLPNLEGMRWFIRECWPLIKQKVPDARLRLVGQDTDGPLKPVGADIDALGWLADPASEISTWSATIIPVLHGAGTRVKIADAFSRKCPVISTRLGAFGYEVENGRELLLADRAADFSEACVSLMTNPGKGTSMAERAFATFLQRWTWEAIAPRIHLAARDAMERSHT